MWELMGKEIRVFTLIWILTGFVCFESSRFVFTGRVFKSLGNHEGSLADVLGNSHRAKGWRSLIDIKF